VLPEGVEGAFRPYKDAYRLGRFAPGAFVKAAWRHRAPIVPFVTVGSVAIRASTQAAIDEIRARRPSVFVGNVFDR
jgi:hypothetical protein